MPAAYFDVDGTLTRTTILHPLEWFQRARLGRVRYAAWAAGLLLRIPYYLWVDARSRSRVNVLIFRHYAGIAATEARAWHARTFADNLERLLFPKALACIAEHKSQGRRIVLVTGGLDAVMAPLAAHLGADLIATRLVERDGVYTGAIDGPPLADTTKADRVRAHAVQHDISLTASFAYGDSVGDLAMLECVGRPVAVNAGAKLRRVAAARGWPVEEWRSV